MGKRRRVAVGLEEDLHEAVQTMAEDQGRSVAEVVRDIVREAVLGEGHVEAVGETARRLLLEGLPDAEVLRRTLEQHPEANTSPESVSWYRSRMRREGLDVPSQVEARRRWEAD
ncbi:MAG: ribbon-helix-helix protein, CopG family [Pseudomonadota bacterium]